MGFLLISSSLVLCYLAGADDRVKNHRLAFAKRCSAYHLWPFLGYLRTRGRKRASIPLGNIYVSRSEEHTSELPSLMRISYAVFCLKKIKHINTHTQSQTIYNTQQYAQ